MIGVDVERTTTLRRVHLHVRHTWPGTWMKSPAFARPENFTAFTPAYLALTLENTSDRLTAFLDGNIQ